MCFFASPLRVRWGRRLELLGVGSLMESGLTTKLRQFSSNVLTLEKSDGFF